MKRINKQLEHSKLQAAFTLLEVMIAVAIIAIMATGAYMTFGDSRSGELKNQSYKLFGLLQLAQEESIIRGVEFGLRVEENGYFFMVYDGENWQPLSDHQLLKDQELAEPFALYVNVEGQESLLKNSPVDEESDGKEDSELADDQESEVDQTQKRKSKTPQIFLLSSGEVNAFNLSFGLDQEDGKFYRISGNYLGDIAITKPIEGHYQADWDKDLEEDDIQTQGLNL